MFAAGGGGQGHYIRHEICRAPAPGGIGILIPPSEPRSYFTLRQSHVLTHFPSPPPAAGCCKDWRHWPGKMGENVNRYKTFADCSC